MKSEMVKERRYIECDCYMPDHLMVVDLLDIDDQPDDSSYIFLAEFGFMSNHRLPWYKRLIYGIKYILFRESYYCYDSVIFSERNVEQLEELVQALKTQQEKLNKEMTL